MESSRKLTYSAESLDELADMVASLFSPIPNRGREPLHMINDHPFGPNEMGVSTYFLSSPEEMLIPYIDTSVSADHHVVPCTGD